MKQYEALSDCLSLVRKSWLSRHEQLQLEILLVEAKKLLLNDAVELDLKANAESEKLFNTLYCLMENICDRKFKPVGFDLVTEFLTEIVIELRNRVKEGAL